MPQKQMEARDEAKMRATVRMVSASMPQMGAIRSGVNPRRCAFRASKPVVRRATKSSSTNPCSITACIRALSRATSVSGLNWRKWVACSAMGLRRGSMTISVLPAAASFFRKVAATGWLAVVWEPMTRITSASAASRTGLETAPEPIISSRAATEEAWQRRVQWSTLLVPNPVRTSFWNR